MHHYERENAKEWQRHSGNGIKPQPVLDNSSDEDVENERPWSQVTFSKHNEKTKGAPNYPQQSDQKTDTPPTKGLIKPAPAPAPVRALLLSRASLRKARRPVSTRITFVQKQDNVAKSAFRKGLPHTSVYKLDQTCLKIEPNRVAMYKRFEEMGIRFGTYIRPPQFLLDRELLLWGAEEQILRTKAELDKWVQAAQEEKVGPREKTMLKSKVEKFGKTGDLQERKDKAVDKKLREEAEKQKYQRDPPELQDFPFRGYFLWPAQEVSPEELLGPSCEAYDSIRTFNSAHILFDTKMSSFKVLSNTEDAIQHVFQRIEGTMREYVARSGKNYSMILVRLPEASKMRKNIRFLPYSMSSGGSSPTSTPHLTGDALSTDEVLQFVEEKAAIEARDRKRIRHAVDKIIARLPFYRGIVRLRVQFGVYAFTTFRGPKGASGVPFSDFLSDITISTTKGSLVRDLQSKAGADQLFAHCTPKKGLFEPMNTMYGAPAEVYPVYTGCFRFSSPDCGEFSLEIEFSKHFGGVYETSRAQWIKKGTTEASSPLDLNVIQLDGGCSWRLQASHEIPMDDSRITPRMADFMSSIAYKAPPAGIRPELTGHKVFKYATNLKFDSFEQKTALRYRHARRKAWVFELARYDSFADNTASASGTTQWGATFLNTEWEHLLGANNILGIGQAANWDPWLSRFFPETAKDGKDKGFQGFLQDVEYITKMLDEMKNLGR